MISHVTSAAGGPAIRIPVDRAVELRVGDLALPGHLRLPGGGSGVVVFAHGSGSSRLSPRNRMVADRLNQAAIGTLLFDLLTEAESQQRANVFDIALLADRLQSAVTWLLAQPEVNGLGIGLFGASTGAAAALVAAARLPATIRAVVSRGGRPDLAGPQLAQVVAPTLLIVGGDDPQVITLNRLALTELRCQAAISVVPGAGHLFEEPGTLEQVAMLATRWFATHLPVGRRTER